MRDVGAFETWLSSLPSDATHGTRKYPLSALAVAKVFPLHESSMGRRYADSESLPVRTPALTYALRPGNTLYRVHLNVGDVFHGFGIGKTSSGKSVMATYLAMAFRSRFPFAGITTIDNGRSARPGCLMVDGQYHDILGPSSPLCATVVVHDSLPYHRIVPTVWHYGAQTRCRPCVANRLVCRAENSLR